MLSTDTTSAKAYRGVARVYTAKNGIRNRGLVSTTASFRQGAQVHGPSQSTVTMLVSSGGTVAFFEPALDHTIEDSLVRGYVSELWAEDWNSDEDSIYDAY